MIYEIAEIEINPGQEVSFEEAVGKAMPYFKAAKGCNHMQLFRSEEFTSRYRLVVEWATLEAHMVDFRESEGFEHWRGLVGGFFAAPPKVEHVSEVYKGF